VTAARVLTRWWPRWPAAAHIGAERKFVKLDPWNRRLAISWCKHVDPARHSGRL